jgi:hypothetical protein
MAKRSEGRPSEEDVVLGEEVEARRKPGAAMVAVRVSSELLERIQNYSRAHGLSVSEAMRMGAEQLVAAPTTASFSLTVRSVADFAPGNVLPDQHAGWATPKGVRAG